MATEEQVENIRQNVEKAVSEITDGAVVGALLLGHFQESKKDLGRLHELLKPLSTYPLELLPQSTADSIIDRLEGLHPIMDGIIGFDIEHQSASEKDDLIAQLHNQAEDIIETVAPWVPYLAYEQGDVQKYIETVHEHEQEADRILGALRDTSAEVGVTTFARVFKDEADTLEKRARPWLKATGWCGGITIFCAIAFVFLPMGESLEQLIQVATTKLIVLGLLLTATAWCGRMYKATMHQAAVNGFRANGLKSFQAFVAATDDDATRNAVLLETTRAIFAHTPTGLIDARAGDSEGSVRIVEVAKDAARKATRAADDAG